MLEHPKAWWKRTMTYLLEVSHQAERAVNVKARVHQGPKLQHSLHECHLGEHMPTIQAKWPPSWTQRSKWKKDTERGPTPTRPERSWLREKNVQERSFLSSDCLWNLNFQFLRAFSETGFLNMFRPSWLRFQAILSESESSARSLTLLLRLSLFPYHTHSLQHLFHDRCRAICKKVAFCPKDPSFTEAAGECCASLVFLKLRSHQM